MRASSGPSTAAGSSNGQCRRWTPPGNTGQVSLALSQTVMTKSRCCPDELVHGLGALAGNIDSDFVHDGDGFRPNLGWLGAGGEHLEPVAAFVAHQPFGHLASGRNCRCRESERAASS